MHANARTHVQLQLLRAMAGPAAGALGTGRGRGVLAAVDTAPARPVL